MATMEQDLARTEPQTESVNRFFAEDGEIRATRRIINALLYFCVNWGPFEDCVEDTERLRCSAPAPAPIAPPNTSGRMRATRLAVMLTGILIPFLLSGTNTTPARLAMIKQDRRHERRKF